MQELFNINILEERISKIRKEGELATDLTLEFLQCLLERHDLESSIPEDVNIDLFPSPIYETLRQGELPSKEQLLMMDNDTQINFILNLIWLCGMNAIAYYTEDSGTEFLDSLLAMLDVSVGHAIGCYIIAALALIQATVPSIEFVASLTNEFDDSPENYNKMQEYLLELAFSVLHRWREDKIYYQTNN
jgi:hypothetical protein